MLPRPDEIANLLKLNHLKDAERNEEELRQFVANAKDFCRDAQNAGTHAGRYLLAYEGCHTLAMACLAHYGTRPAGGEGHRAIALQLFVNLIKLNELHRGSFKTLTDAHHTRNRTTYESPVPPVTEAQAAAVLQLLLTALPATEALIFA